MCFKKVLGHDDIVFSNGIVRPDPLTGTYADIQRDVRRFRCRALPEPDPAFLATMRPDLTLKKKQYVAFHISGFEFAEICNSLSATWFACSRPHQVSAMHCGS